MQTYDESRITCENARRFDAIFGRIITELWALECLLVQTVVTSLQKKVQVGKDQEKAQSEKDSHSKNQGGKKPN